MIVMVNAAGDILYGLLDPRIRLWLNPTTRA